MNDFAIQACRALIEWFDKEKEGPDYGGKTRDTHPEGQKIWGEWYNEQLDLCDRAEHLARKALEEEGK